MHLTQYYTELYDEEARLLPAAGQVEFLTTMRYLERYLRPNQHVLELGAGTGRYSLALARAGYRVTALELVQHNIDVFRHKLRPTDHMILEQGNALDLSRFRDETFDVTLLLGPMYHLYTRDDQSLALREALRVTKPGGLLFAAYCMADSCLLYSGFLRGQVDAFLAEGKLRPEGWRCLSQPKDIFQLYRREDIEALTAPLPCERLHYVAADGLSRFMREALDQMPPERFALFLEYHWWLCERPGFADATEHSLDILRKWEGAK
ncbi:MAG: class I SAM-dependent methyltransferase [Oscillospiraceae bacterium]|jgi:ubiquinone/menaquinone biosynthesis C-methylase UbiE|nr:class I SAM-dependent methyltransferase [Oscillospiraceae bacterium]